MTLDCYEFAEFHITFEVPGHNLHFYYHETRVCEFASQAGGSKSHNWSIIDCIFNGDNW